MVELDIWAPTNSGLSGPCLTPALSSPGMGSLSGAGDTGPCLAIPKQSILLQDGAHSGEHHWAFGCLHTHCRKGWLPCETVIATRTGLCILG